MYIYIYNVYEYIVLCAVCLMGSFFYCAAVGPVRDALRTCFGYYVCFVLCVQCLSLLAYFITSVSLSLSLYIYIYTYIPIHLSLCIYIYIHIYRFGVLCGLPWLGPGNQTNGMGACLLSDVDVCSL